MDRMNTHPNSLWGRIALLLCALCAVGTVVLPSKAEAERPKLTFTTFQSEGMGQLFERILTEAYDRLGYDVEIERVPAQRALVMANTGKVDGEAGRVPVIEMLNNNLIRVPTPLYINTIKVFTKRSDIDTTQGWDALSRYSVASVIGYKYIEKMIRNMRHTHVSDYEKLFTMLEGGRVDLVVAEYFDALPSFKHLHSKDVHVLEPPLAFNPMYHYLHEKNAKLVPLVDAVLKDMVREGRIEAIKREILEELQQR